MNHNCYLYKGFWQPWLRFCANRILKALEDIGWWGTSVTRRQARLPQQSLQFLEELAQWRLQCYSPTLFYLPNESMTTGNIFLNCFILTEEITVSYELYRITGVWCRVGLEKHFPFQEGNERDKEKERCNLVLFQFNKLIDLLYKCSSLHWKCWFPVLGWVDC